MEDHVAVIVAFFAVAVLESYVYACDLDGVQRCATEFQSKSSGMQVAGISSMPSKEQLDRVCGLLGEFRECYRPKIEGCGNDASFQMMFGLIGNTVDFLCEEGYSDIIKYESCWQRKDVTDAMNTCAQKTTNDMANTQSSSSSKSEMASSFCSILHSAEVCMENGVRSRCGEEPGNLVKRMLTRIYRDLHNIMNCKTSVESGESSIMPMVTGIVVSLITFLLL